jgi:uncharacterized membrane protein YfcA
MNSLITMLLGMGAGLGLSQGWIVWMTKNDSANGGGLIAVGLIVAVSAWLHLRRNNAMRKDGILYEQGIVVLKRSSGLTYCQLKEDQETS